MIDRAIPFSLRFEPGFARILPSLIAAYDEIPGLHPLKPRLSDQIAVLRGWDYRWDVSSVAMSLARDWVNELLMESKAIWCRMPISGRRWS